MRRHANCRKVSDILAAISRFPRLQYVELDMGVAYHSLERFSLDRDSWLQVSVAEGVFRRIVAEKERSNLSLLPFKALDFKWDSWGRHFEWSPRLFLKDDMLPVYACRWAGGGTLGDQVRVFPLQRSMDGSIIGDDLYDEALVASGLRRFSTLLDGPWAL